MARSDGYKVSGFFANTADPERTKRMAFHDLHTLVIDYEDPNLSWDQRELLKQVGEKFYGKLKPKA